MPHVLSLSLFLEKFLQFVWADWLLTGLERAWENFLKKFCGKISSGTFISNTLKKNIEPVSFNTVSLFHFGLLHLMLFLTKKNKSALSSPINNLRVQNHRVYITDYKACKVCCIKPEQKTNTLVPFWLSLLKS